MTMKDLIESIKNHEGFKEYPYIDPLVNNKPSRYGIPEADMQVIRRHFDKLKVTFGFGFTFLTEEEAKAVLEIRIKKVQEELAAKILGFSKFDNEIKLMLSEMAYQLGVTGVSHFRKMLAAISKKDWCEAYNQGKDSRWYRQTTRRAEEVLSVLKNRCEKQKTKLDQVEIIDIEK